jgi:hypothetical protein
LKFRQGPNVTTQDKLQSQGQTDHETTTTKAGMRLLVNLTSIDWPTRHSVTPPDALHRSRQRPDMPILCPRALCSCTPVRPPRRPCPLHSHMPL